MSYPWYTFIKCGLEILVRLPHTSHVLQIEDVVTFRSLKNQFRAANAALIIHQEMTLRVLVIKREHMLHLQKRPWEATFCREKVVTAWKVTGYVPFTHQVYWNLSCKENQTAETIVTTMRRSNLIYKASMAIIAASGGKTAGF